MRRRSTVSSSSRTCQFEQPAKEEKVQEQAGLPRGKKAERIEIKGVLSGQDK